jgi:protein involved in polysaccharide export with SLBB domain
MIFGGKVTVPPAGQLVQFGYHIFGMPSSTFAPIENMPVGPDYLLGPDDSMIISVWGKTQEIFNLTVDRDGKITLPKAGTVYVWGLKFHDAEKLIKDSLGEVYANFQVNITMGRLRTIRVFVLGDVKKPGSYTMSSVSTVFHALYESGGPTKSGSMRKVRLIRENISVTEIDLYDFLLKGDKSQDLRLESNDTVFIPTIGAVCGISGSVRRPAIYEMKGETPLSDLVEMSGGVTPIGYMHRLQLERIKSHERRVVSDLEFTAIEDLKSSELNIQMEDGDLVKIFPIPDLKYNYVSVYGNILRPGDYEFHSGMRVSQLLEKAGGILMGTYTQRAEISRLKNDRTREIIPFNVKNLLAGDPVEDVELAEWDMIRVYTKSEVIPVLYVSITGAVYKPGTYELTPNMKTTDLIFRAGGLKKNACLEKSELYRTVLGEQPRVINVRLANIIDAPGSPEDLILDDNDSLYVREESKWTQKRRIVLAGEFVFPGEYVALGNETLSSVIHRAGGFTPQAFLKGAVFTRNSLKEAQRANLDRFIRSERMTLLRQQTMLSSATTPEVERKQMEELLRQRASLIDLLSTVEIPGRMITNLSELPKFKGSEYDILIEDGDHLSVPQVPSGVQVIGSVYNPLAVPYKEGRGLDYYLSAVGGATRNADKKDIYVIRADGEVDSRFTRIKDIGPGDTIVVPEEFRLFLPPGQVAKDAIQIFSQLALGAAAIAAIQ